MNLLNDLISINRYRKLFNININIIISVIIIMLSRALDSKNIEVQTQLSGKKKISMYQNRL